MAHYYGANATKIRNAPIAQLAENAEQSGRVHTIYDEFDIAVQGGGVAPGTGDIVDVGGLIPAGARVLGFEVDCPAIGGSAAMEAGYAASADGLEAAQAAGFLPSASVVSAAQPSMSASPAGSQVGKFHLFLGAVQPQLKFTTGGSATTGKIRTRISYIFD